MLSPPWKRFENTGLGRTRAHRYSTTKRAPISGALVRFGLWVGECRIAWSCAFRDSNVF